MRKLFLAMMLAAPLWVSANPSADGNAQTGFTLENADASWNDMSRATSTDTATQPVWSSEALPSSTSTVHEPGPYVLLLAGLGAVGLVIRRRRPR